jgi:hypothetical protein
LAPLPLPGVRRQAGLRGLCELRDESSDQVRIVPIMPDDVPALVSAVAAGEALARRMWEGG